jgi:hypothetical protein
MVSIGNVQVILFNHMRIYIFGWGSLTMDYFNNLDNELLKKYKKILKIEKGS